MKITIELDVYDEEEDENDATCLTEEAWTAITGHLGGYGDIIDIRKSDD